MASPSKTCSAAGRLPVIPIVTRRTECSDTGVTARHASGDGYLPGGDMPVMRPLRGRSASLSRAGPDWGARPPRSSTCAAAAFALSMSPTGHISHQADSSELRAQNTCPCSRRASNSSAERRVQVSACSLRPSLWHTTVLCEGAADLAVSSRTGGRLRAHAGRGRRPTETDRTSLIVFVLRGAARVSYKTESQYAAGWSL